MKIINFKTFLLQLCAVVVLNGATLCFSVQDKKDAWSEQGVESSANIQRSSQGGNSETYLTERARRLLNDYSTGVGFSRRVFGWPERQIRKLMRELFGTPTESGALGRMQGCLSRKGEKEKKRCLTFAGRAIGDIKLDIQELLTSLPEHRKVERKALMILLTMCLMLLKDYTRISQVSPELLSLPIDKSNNNTAHSRNKRSQDLSTRLGLCDSFLCV